MAKKRKVKSIARLARKKSSGMHKSGMTSLVVGAVAGVAVAGTINKFASKSNIPMASTLSPLAVILGASFYKSEYSNGMIAGASALLLQGMAKQYFPTFQEYVTLSGESSDPLLGAQYLYGEEQDQYVIQGMEDEYVVAGGISDDPLE
jgi:hypothetical protein